MFHLPCINQAHNIKIINKKHFNVQDVFYSLAVGIAIRYGLDGPGIVQTGPETHPASYTTGTESFPEGKAAGAWR